MKKLEKTKSLENCKHCHNTGLLYIWRIPDFQNKTHNPAGSYQVNGPQWVTPFAGCTQPDRQAYSSVALCSCSAGDSAKLKYPNLRVFQQPPDQEEVPF